MHKMHFSEQKMHIKLKQFIAQGIQSTTKLARRSQKVRRKCLAMAKSAMKILVYDLWDSSAWQ
jgi:hypothetical protein